MMEHIKGNIEETISRVNKLSQFKLANIPCIAQHQKERQTAKKLQIQQTILMEHWQTK